MPRLKILEMIDRPFLGGGQRHLLSLAEHLNREEFEVSVCSAGGGPLEERTRELGLVHYAVAMPKRPLPRSAGALSSLFASVRFDLVHTHGGVAGLFGRWAAAENRIPAVIHTLHGIHYLHYRNPLNRRIHIGLERWCSRRTDGIICVSDTDLNKALRYRLAPAEKLTVIKNGIDYNRMGGSVPGPDAAAGIKAKLGVESGRPVIGTVARLHYQKNIPFLIQAAARVAEALPDVALIIVGGGPEEERIHGLVRELGMERNVILAGEREDAVELMSLFDMFVLSSRWEGLPYVLMEAGGMAKAVVATAVDGVAEMITHGENGWLVPAGDGQAFSEALIRLLRDGKERERLGLALQAHVREAYTQDRMVKETERLYRRLLSH
ncbi:MAG: glycosyltransferase family 4 protein [Acidobacteriota bacterium]